VGGKRDELRLLFVELSEAIISLLQITSKLLDFLALGNFLDDGFDEEDTNYNKEYKKTPVYQLVLCSIRQQYPY
jgi:hypothetical protein